MQTFINEQVMGDKDVEALPAIGKALGTRLRENNIEKAYQVLGMFLALQCDDDAFKAWLKDKSNANSKQQEDCMLGVKG